MQVILRKQYPLILLPPTHSTSISTIAFPQPANEFCVLSLQLTEQCDESTNNDKWYEKHCALHKHILLLTMGGSRSFMILFTRKACEVYFKLYSCSREGYTARSFEKNSMQKRRRTSRSEGQR